MQITITDKDILKGRECVTASGMLIDELAYSAGEATQDDLDPDFYGQDEAIEYVVKEHNYETELLQQTKTPDQLSLMCAVLSNSAYSVPKDVKHAGAYLALHEPENFATVLDAYRDKCKEEAWNYYDSDFLRGGAPDLVKELREAVDAQNEQNHKEWLHGDHRDYAGVLSLIAKYYGASERLEYNEKKGDSVVFTFDDNSLYESVTGEYSREEGAKMPSMAVCKEWLISAITSSINAKHEKNKAEAAKRKEERERVTAYKAERQAQEDRERREKLAALLK